MSFLQSQYLDHSVKRFTYRDKGHAEQQRSVRESHSSEVTAVRPELQQEDST